MTAHPRWLAVRQTLVLSLAGLMVVLAGILSIAHLAQAPLWLTWAPAPSPQIFVGTTLTLAVIGTLWLWEHWPRLSDRPPGGRVYLALHIALVGLALLGLGITLTYWQRYGGLSPFLMLQREEPLRMGFISAALMAMSSSAVLAMRAYQYQRSPGWCLLSGLLGLVVLDFSVFGLMDYVLGIPYPFRLKVSLPGAVGYFLLSSTLLLINANQHDGLMAPLFSEQARVRWLAWIGISVGVMVYLSGLNSMQELFQAPLTATLPFGGTVSAVHGLLPAVVSLQLKTIGLSATIKVLWLRMVHYYEESLRVITQARQLEQRLRDRMRRERLLRRIAESTNQTFALESMLQSIVRDLCQFFQADRCVISRIDADPQDGHGGSNGLSRPIAQFCRNADIAPVEPASLTAEDLRYLEPLFSAAVPAAQFIHEQTPHLPKSFRDLIKREHIQSALLQAIPHHQRPYAVVALHQCNSLRLWRPEEIDLLRSVSAHLGVAFQQAQLFRTLELARAAAEDANRKKDQFLANMSHELRTPLNAIIGFSDMLTDGLAGPLTDKQSHYIQNVAMSGHHLLDMVNDILDLSKIAAGKVQISREPVQLAALLADVSNVMAPLAQQQAVTLTMNLRPPLTTTWADPSRLKQILLNLVSNATKFNRRGGQVTVTLQMDDLGQDLIGVVADTGIGIAAQQLPHLFKEFNQLSTGYARQFEGTGLGLALTRRLVELHHGSIAVESQEGVGSRFIFRLPLHPAAAHASPSAGAGVLQPAEIKTL